MDVYGLGFGTLIAFRGADRRLVFNNMTTQDFRSLDVGQARETFVTDGKGKVFGHGIGLALTDRLCFLTVPDQASKLVPHFDRYIIREDATVADVSSSYDWWLFPNSELIGNLIGNTLAPHTCVTLSMAGGDAIATHAPWISDDSWIVMLPREVDGVDWVRSLGGEPVRSEMACRDAWEWKRIEQFWPWCGVDMDEKNLPQELDRNDEAISFTKGCYLGQETIARLDALGQVQKKLLRLSIDGVDGVRACRESMVLFYDEVEVGRITSVHERSPSHSIALGYVKRAHFQPGTKLSFSSVKDAVTVMQRS